VFGAAQAKFLEFAAPHAVEISQVGATLEQGREHARYGGEETAKGPCGGKLWAELVEHLRVLLFDAVTIAQHGAAIFGANLKSSEKLLIDWYQDREVCSVMQMMFGDYTLRRHERELLGPAGPIEISGRSFDLLSTLLERPNELLDKATLFDAVWPGVVVEENTLQVHMSALRKVLGSGFIATVHGRGYKYVGPTPREVPEATASRPAAVGGNINRYRSECVARDAEIAAIGALVETHRLVSIVGPGGVGKTTVAVAVGASMTGKVGDGVWMVDLAAVNSGDYLESVLIQALAIPFRAGSKSLESIVEYLRSSDSLLVFDNCEHVRGAVARIITAILNEAPLVRILTTSQIPLGVAEERVFKLMPFAISAAEGEHDGDLASAQFLAHCYASFGETISPEEMSVVARLCTRLDGVALALKMAAARAATLGLETVDKQLEEHLAGLSADWDPALARHRSLAASLAWSYDLLSPEDRRTLRSLAVFRGSFSVDGVNAVAGAGSEPRIAELVRRSLVVRESGDRTRYRLLDSTRQFALDQLAEAGEDGAVRERHAHFVDALFQHSIEQWEVLPDDVWDQTYRPDGDNLRVALSWAKTTASWPIYVSLAANSYRYFIEEQLGAEGLATVEAGMSLVGSVPPELAARLQQALGEMCRFNAMDIRARQGLEPALAYFRTSGDHLRYRQALVLLCWISIFFGPEGEAAPLVEELQSAIAEQPSSKVKSWALTAMGIHMWLHGDTVAGLARCEAGLAMHIATGNPKGRFRSVMNLSEMFHKGGDTERSLRLVEEILPELRRSGASLQLGFHLNNLAAYHLSLGNPLAARAPLKEAATIVPRDGGNWHWCLLQNAAELMFVDGDSDVAALLLGFTDKCFEGWPDGRQDTEIKQRDRLLANLGRALSHDRFERLMQQGRSLSLFEADHLAGFISAKQPSVGT
jgi:predicted ATPase/DNA-binding winged helix-turn-helix (wHTH) protein